MLRSPLLKETVGKLCFEEWKGFQYEAFSVVGLNCRRGPCSALRGGSVKRFKVFDGNGRFIARTGSKTSAITMARAAGGFVVTGNLVKPTWIYDGSGKGRANPGRSMLFKTRAAALKYAREHGAKRFSIQKLTRGR
jgi:hypothetical protein